MRLSYVEIFLAQESQGNFAYFLKHEQIYELYVKYLLWTNQPEYL